MRGKQNSEDLPEGQGLSTRLPDWAREREDGQWYGTRPAGRPSRQAKPKAPTNLIVVVPDEGEDDWTKARVVDSPEQAAALVEKLVQEGLAPEQVSVFAATHVLVNVAYKPLVDLEEMLREEERPK